MGNRSLLRTWRTVTVLACLGLMAGLAHANNPAQDWPDQLTVYAIPAPRPIKWGTPRRLALRALGNMIAFEHRDYPHPIGHVFVHLRSSSTGRDLMTGMTSRSPTEDRDLILKDDYGLGVLGADMMGRLEETEELQEEIQVRARSGLIARMRFLISPEASARLIQFLDQYAAQGDDDHYGGANRPRYAEGGGCSAFGIAFMQLAGLMQPDFESWRVDFRVPKRLYGGPLNGVRAPMSRVIWEGRRWANEDEPHVASMFWDPTRMYQWIRRTYRDEQDEPTGRWTTELEEEMRGLTVDARSAPVPSDTIWLEDPAGSANPYGRQESVRREAPPEPASRGELERWRQELASLETRLLEIERREGVVVDEDFEPVGFAPIRNAKEGTP